MDRPVIIIVDREGSKLENRAADLRRELEGRAELRFAAGDQTAFHLCRELIKEGRMPAVVAAVHAPPSVHADELLARIHGVAPLTRKILLGDARAALRALRPARLFGWFEQEVPEHTALYREIAEALAAHLREKALETAAARAGLPLDIVPAAAVTPTNGANLEGNERRVLIVEDNEVMRMYMERVFTRSGYRVEMAAHGREGVEKVVGFRPELIVTDLMMPHMSGLEFIEHVRARPEGNGTPIILLTVKSDSETREAVHSAGADGYLSKPFEDRELLAVTRNLLSLKSREKVLEKEMTHARKIQHSLMPMRLPRTPGLNLTARYLPMDSIGGDLYDFMELPGGDLGIFIGDVSGHGVPAAMLASATRMLLSSFGERFPMPGAMLAHMNESLHGKTAGNFLTCLLGIIDRDRTHLKYSMGGHPPLLLLRDGKVTRHGGKGALIGLFPNVSFREFELELKQHDRLLFFTDGIIETRNSRDEMFGDDRLTQCCARYCGESLEEFVSLLLADVLDFQRGRIAQDDVTLVCVDIP